MRGPIVYCLEGVDLPDEVSILEVHAGRDMALSARHERDLLGGVTVVDAAARRVVDDNENGALYYDADDERDEPLDIRLIPYYAWNNRGIDEMTVWLPRR